MRYPEKTIASQWLYRAVGLLEQNVPINPDVEFVSWRNLDRRLNVEIFPRNLRTELAHLSTCGAHGFLLKDNDIGIIIEGIHAVYENGYYFNEHISPEMVQDITDKKLPKTVPGVPLSQREIEIIRLICMEYTNKEISDKLFISARTVGAHRENIFRKINAKNMISVMKYAIRNKLVD